MFTRILKAMNLRPPPADNFIYDGVTTVITGNCGASNVDLDKYFSWIDSLKLSVNVGLLIGHNDVRKAVMGKVSRDPAESELKQMEDLVSRAMKDGASGFIYRTNLHPGTYSKTAEVVRLAKVASQIRRCICHAHA
jgi:N-acyl-D-amino-acid deacylase